MTVPLPAIDQSSQQLGAYRRVLLWFRNGLPTILALIFCFFWSSAFIANKINLRYAPPLWNLTIRFIFAGTVVLAAAYWRGLAFPRNWQAYARLGWFGFFNTALYMLFTLWGLAHVSAGTAAILASTNPLVLTLLGPLVLHESLTRAKLAGVLLGFGGVCFVMLARLGTQDSLVGMLWIGAGVLSLIFATVLFKWYPPREPLIVANGVQLLVSGLVMLPLALLDAPISEVHFGWPLLFGLGYVTIGVSIVGMAIWLWLLQRGEASKVSAYYFLTPIMGLALSTMLLGDRFGGRELLGLLAVVCGIILVNRPVQRAQ